MFPILSSASPLFSASFLIKTSPQITSKPLFHSSFTFTSFKIHFNTASTSLVNPKKVSKLPYHSSLLRHFTNHPSKLQEPVIVQLAHANKRHQLIHHSPLLAPLCRHAN
jgi:hypothetical protein